MKISIMQPTFLPWVGYFNMIIRSDLFVFLDDVQFERRSFQSRNKLIINNSAKLISVPVDSKNKFSQLLSEVKINYDRDWVKDHLKSIYYNYCKHKFFTEIYSILEKDLNCKDDKLVSLNCKLIRSICKYLEIDTKFDNSYKYKIKEKKSKKILGLLKSIGATHYLTPERAKDYLGEDGKILKDENIEVTFLSYECNKYEQKNSKSFISHLSIIDLLFNHGKDSKSLI
jgi:hypothetical protein